MASTAWAMPEAPPEAQRPLLEVRNLHVTYGHLPVLGGVDFVVRPGELVALTGENGAGKSTVVRCIVGDTVPEAGEVVIAGGRVRSNQDAARSGVAVVWQHAALCENLDVAANLFLGQEAGRWLVSDVKTNVASRQILASYGINMNEARPVRFLSTGQRQLLAVVKALQAQPRLLVLDEPTASLGVHETRQVEDLIVKLKAQGTTVLLVSHNVEQVFQLSDRVVVLRRGRVEADLYTSETHPDDLVAIMSGHQPDATARHQLNRLQMLVDQLASATPSSNLPLIVSALGAALGVEQLCVHLLEDGALRLVATTGLPAEIQEAWSCLPVGAEGGPMGVVAATERPEIDEDVETSRAWARFAAVRRRAAIRSSWSVPLMGPSGLIGVITGCQPTVGRPQRDQMDLVSLYAGYAGGVIERDRLFVEVTARNQVLETIRDILESIAGPYTVAAGLSLALRSLHRGLRASEIELWLQGSGEPARCAFHIDQANEAHHEPEGRDGADAAAAAFSAGRVRGATWRLEPLDNSQVLLTTFDAPVGRAALFARWSGVEPPEYAAALLGDAAHSVRLALEREEAEQAHQQAAALLRSHQLQRDFLSRLSHELRTPLTAIRGYASSLLASDVTWDDESKLRFLDRIAGESARLGRLVGDLLDFSAIESGLLRLQQDWCDLPLVIEAAVSCLPPGHAEAVTVSRAPSMSPVWADHDRLEQVFVNLLDNALRHNGPEVKVTVEVSFLGPDHVTVDVADDGKGVSAELRAQLFDSQARSVVSALGTGLGISIARGIVSAHGGRMELVDADHGARFRVTLPIEGTGPGPSNPGEQ